MANALEGIRVIDLTVWFQGPVAAQHLADFGAEVIHVERPKGGDQGRGVRSIKALPVGDWNQYFLVINRNKKSMALDLKHPARARDHVPPRRAVGRVPLEPRRRQPRAPGSSPTRSSPPINPRLVYATTTGYGHYGTTQKPSFDMTVQALTGLMSRLGEPGQPPIYLGMGSGDAYGGLMAAFAILLALHHRAATGKGQLIDASLYGAQLFLAAPTLQAFLATGSDALLAPAVADGAARTRSGTRTRRRTGGSSSACPNTDESWSAALPAPSVTTALGRRPALRDREWKRRDARQRAWSRPSMACSRDERAAEWMERWSERGIAASPIDNLAELARDPQAWANDYLMKTHCEEVHREVTIRGLPVRLSKTPGRGAEPRPRARSGHRADPRRDARLLVGRDRRR